MVYRGGRKPGILFFFIDIFHIIIYNSNMEENDYSANPFSYCDYRCDTCERTGSCKVYAQELADRDKSFEEVLSENMKKMKEMVYTYLEENDIDPEEMKEEAEDEDYDRLHRLVEEKEVVQLSYEYLDKTGQFLEDYRAHYLVPGVLMDAFSDLGWYHTLIPVKMQRALHSTEQFLEEPEELHLEDAYLTSLVVYKSLWKSLAAVADLKKSLVDYEDELGELEEMLESIKRYFRHEFPFEIFANLILKAQEDEAG